MLRVAVLVALFAVSFCAPSLNQLYELEWTLFKQEHNKNYAGTEELRRRLIWEQNVHYIQKHNLEADRGVHTYWLGMNEYGDMTGDEFVGAMNGYIMANGSSSTSTFMAPNNYVAPDSIDWRPQGYVTAVKNQGQCGSCWAFSATGSLEGQTFKKTKTLTSLSEQNLVDCSKKEGNKGCQGGLMDQAFKYIKINHGIDTEQSYPYKGKNEKCKFTQANVGATDTGFTDIQKGSETDLMNAVATIGPISVAMDASHQSLQLYKRGIYTERRCSSKKLDHGVLAVGYGTETGKDFWIVKNSWGKTWGMEGYFNMARNDNNMCGIATSASYPLV